MCVLDLNDLMRNKSSVFLIMKRKFVFCCGNCFITKTELSMSVVFFYDEDDDDNEEAEVSSSSKSSSSESSESRALSIRPPS